MEQSPAKRCPACGGEMECKLRNFSIGADGGGGLLTLLADTYEVDLYACPHCGKVDLFTAGFQPAEEKPAPPPPEEEAVTCPVCGARHSPLIGCPNCALHGASSSLFSRKKKGRGPKPPWEG